MEKPKKPIEPKWEDFPAPKEPNGKNHLGQPIYQKLDWVMYMKKHEKDLEKYHKDLETYQQLKLIRLVKNASEKLILKKYKIFRNEDVPKPSKGNNKVIFNLKD